CGEQLSPYSACTVQIGFQPTALEAYAAHIAFTVAVHEPPVEGEAPLVQAPAEHVILLKGAGGEVLSELVADPKSVDFGVTSMHEPVRRTVSLSNHSEQAQSLRVSYATNAENFVVLGGCAGQIPSGSTCELELLYQAASPNRSNGELILVSRETNQTLSIPLTGAAPMPDLTVRPQVLR